MSMQGFTFVTSSSIFFEAHGVGLSKVRVQHLNFHQVTPQPPILLNFLDIFFQQLPLKGYLFFYFFTTPLHPYHSCVLQTLPPEASFREKKGWFSLAERGVICSVEPGKFRCFCSALVLLQEGPLQHLSESLRTNAS